MEEESIPSFDPQSLENQIQPPLNISFPLHVPLLYPSFLNQGLGRQIQYKISDPNLLFTLHPILSPSLDLCKTLFLTLKLNCWRLLPVSEVRYLMAIPMSEDNSDATLSITQEEKDMVLGHLPLLIDLCHLSDPLRILLYWWCKNSAYNRTSNEIILKELCHLVDPDSVLPLIAPLTFIRWEPVAITRASYTNGLTFLTLDEEPMEIGIQQTRKERYSPVYRRYHSILIYPKKRMKHIPNTHL